MKDLLKSKKFQTAIIGGLSIVVIKIAALNGFVLDPATGQALAEVVLQLATAFILAQGVADFGKSGKLAELLAGAKKVAESVSADDTAEEPAAEAPKPE